MALDADSFCSMVADPSDFTDAEGNVTTRGKWRKRALYLCAANYEPRMSWYTDRGRRELMEKVKPQLKAEAKQEYGSILVIIGVTLLTTILSWAITKFLNWLTSKNKHAPDPSRVEMCRTIRKHWEQQQ